MENNMNDESQEPFSLSPSKSFQQNKWLNFLNTLTVPSE
jgi:hypothetical protein